MKTRLDFIWNVTRLCSWDCSVCCVDAIRLRRLGSDQIELKDNNLSKSTKIAAISGKSAFGVAHENLVSRGIELDLPSKLEIVDQVSQYPARLDISGGDPLELEENWQVLEAASALLGKSNVSLTATGPGIRINRIPELAALVDEVNVTYAPTVDEDYAARPKSYSSSNLILAKQLVDHGLRVRVEVPLTRNMCQKEMLESIYYAVQGSGAQRILLMRLFPVGRGFQVADEIPSSQEYTNAIKILRDLEKTHRTPNVSLQCALRSIEQTARTTNPCDLATNSFGIMPNGDLLLSPWAISTNGRALSKDWIIGNIVESGLEALISSEAVLNVRKLADKNFGHCKIFAALNSNEADFLDKLASKTDPLYSNTSK